MVKNNSFSI